MPLTLLTPAAARASFVRRNLPVIAWAMLRFRNEKSRAFRGHYTPDAAPWGVEICECQYWPHVRTVDVVGSPQLGKSFHVVELPTLYDLCEGRETVFLLNGSADNAVNMWTTRWYPSMQADPVLRQQVLERLDAGRWDERHLADGGLLYSAGPESAAALSQRESRVIRCSELEKTRGAVGKEASSYALAKDRAAAYPLTSIVTSDCTITTREGLSWVRFRQGDRSRPAIPCPACGRYAIPAAPAHLDEPDLALTTDTIHRLEPGEISTASTANSQAKLLCSCGHAFTNREFAAAMRAVVWLPVGCVIVRHDDPRTTPIPNVSWLDDLHKWAIWNLSRQNVREGREDPDPPPAWSGPRLPDGVELEWNQQSKDVDDADVLPALRQDPRQNPARSFWLWRLLAPRYTPGMVAREIVMAEHGQLTGDELDDRKTLAQKCLVIPWVEPTTSLTSGLDEDAVLACVVDLERGKCPIETAIVTAGVDIGDDEVHFALRAWTLNGESFLVNHGVTKTGFRELRGERGLRYQPLGSQTPDYQATRWKMVAAALDELMGAWAVGVPDVAGALHPVNLIYLDSGYLSAEVYAYCARWHFDRIRPIKGRGSGVRIGRRSIVMPGGQWTDACDKKALLCADGRGRPLRHQYFEPADPRRLMFLEADHWKREVHAGIIATAQSVQTPAAGASKTPAPRGWFWMHGGVAAKHPVPGSKLERRDRYVTQVVAERWEEWMSPRLKRLETGWRVYQDANHLLDAEAYAMAAAAACGWEATQSFAPVQRAPAQRPRRPLPQSSATNASPEMG